TALLGSSLGGVNAYQFAARYPWRVRALAIEDIGVEVPGEMPPMTGWGAAFASRDELEKQVGPRMLPYLKDSIRQTADGIWQLAFNPDEMAISQRCMAGNHWTDWLATDCPALVIRGADSRVTTDAEMTLMVE